MHGFESILFWIAVAFIRTWLTIFCFVSFSLAKEYRDEGKTKSEILGNLVYGGMTVALLLASIDINNIIN